MKKNDYSTMGSGAAKLAAEGLRDEQVMTENMQDRAYLLATADAMATCVAEQQGVKKSVATFFDAFRRTFTALVQERQRNLREAAKPVFWGDDKTKRAAFEGSDVRMWTLVSQMDELKSTRRDLVSRLESLIRDAQTTLARVQAQDEAGYVNAQLYPVYDENLGQMGQRADAEVLKLRMQQEATRTMVNLTGMRLPTRAELLAAGLVAPSAEELAEALLPQQAPAAGGQQ